MARTITLSDVDIQHMSMSELGDLLIEAKKAYYLGSQPIMDDHTYDTLEQILAQKKPHHRFFQKIGTNVANTGFDKKNHTRPMGSQNKVTNLHDLKKYFNRHSLPPSTEFVVQPKLDGLSISLEYQNGQIQAAVTRGNGLTGDVITQNVSTMRQFKSRLAKPFTGSIRAELIISKTDFSALTKEVGQNVYSNPRNAASGIAQRLDGKYSNYCTVCPVDIVFSNPNHTPPTELKALDYIRQTGLVPIETVFCKTLYEVESAFQTFYTTKRLTFPYAIDGLVVKINSLATQKTLGAIQGKPKGQVAYKFPADSKDTKLAKISWQVGPLGHITPVAILTPVEVAGAIVTKASLGNKDLIMVKNIQVGDIVHLSRRGDVIPYVESVTTKINPGTASIPTLCPSCQTKLVVEPKYLLCPNHLSCPAQVIGTLRLFSKALGIDAIATKTIQKLYTAGKLTKPGDFYTLTVSDFESLPGLGRLIGNKIITQIQNRRSLSVEEVFEANAIPNLSQARLQELINHGFNKPEHILCLTVSDLVKLKGYKTTLAQKIVQGIKLRRANITSVLAQVTIIQPTQTIRQSLAKYSFCLTGAMTKPRTEIIKLIEQNGGTIRPTVSSKLQYLVSNQPNSSSTKTKTAKKLGIPIISEADLYALITKQ